MHRLSTFFCPVMTKAMPSPQWNMMDFSIPWICFCNQGHLYVVQDELVFPVFLDQHPNSRPTNWVGNSMPPTKSTLYSCLPPPPPHTHTIKPGEGPGTVNLLGLSWLINQILSGRLHKEENCTCKAAIRCLPSSSPHRRRWYFSTLQKKGLVKLEDVCKMTQTGATRLGYAGPVLEWCILGSDTWMFLYACYCELYSSYISAFQ